MELEALQTMADQGGMDILTPEEQMALQEPAAEELNTKHYENLAESMKENKLDKMAEDLIELVEQDDESRKDWWSRVETGMKFLGVTSDTVGGADFEGASTVVHPILMDAVTQFQSRAIQEMWPSKGPVTTQVLGTQTPERMDQAKRVKDYMNYLYMIEMPEAFTEEDNMLLRLPISGSCFKKMFYDPLKKRLSSKFIEPTDFIISYQTTDLATSPRYTHRIREYPNDVRKKEKSGYYIETETSDLHDEDFDKPDIITVIDGTEGKERVTNASDDDTNDRATMYEIYVDYNVEETEDKKALLLPYIITVDRDERKIKRIQRNWKPDDEKQEKRQYFTHYKFTPGLGFYGYGFLHLIGDLAISATGSLRSLLDAAGFSNMQGGFRSRDSRMPGGDKPISPGEWREVNSTAEELAKGFFPLPYKEPSATLFNLLAYLDEKATALVGNTDIVKGESNPKDAPVGTTAMLLEQGMKVFTSIHKRLHESHKKEFKIMAELVEEYMPDEGYPYLLGEEDSTLMPSDFDTRIDVIPVSDPNLASTAQRITKAQGILEIHDRFPDVVDQREAAKRMLVALDTVDIDSLIGSEEEYKESQQKNTENMEAEKAHVETMRQFEIQKAEAEIANIQSEIVQRNVDTTATALDSAAKIILGVQAPEPVPVPMTDAIEPTPGVPGSEGKPATPGTEGKPAEVIPTVPPVADSTALSATADAILDSAGFVDKSGEQDMPNALNGMEPQMPPPDMMGPPSMEEQGLMGPPPVDMMPQQM